jgi:hypothetical protein
MINKLVTACIAALCFSYFAYMCRNVGFVPTFCVGCVFWSLFYRLWSGRHVLSVVEEMQAKEFVDAVASTLPPDCEGFGDDDAETERQEGEVPAFRPTIGGHCALYAHLSDRHFRTDVVKRAIFDIRADIGPLRDTPANQLVLAREYRKWAKARGLRPSHTETFRPYVMVGYFLKSEHDIRAESYAISAAYHANLRDRSRWSVAGLIRPSWWAPLEGSTAE